jgi:cytochrome c oxidase subunit 1
MAIATPTRTRPALEPVPQIIRHAATRPRSRHAWIDWLTTTDHKKIGILYLVTCLVFFAFGGTEALLMRIQLGAPNSTFLTPAHYNELFSMHGSTMVFLVIVPIWAGFGNYFMPLMIGARDMAFPRLNALSYWLFLFGGIVFYFSLFWQGPDAGWFSYAPLSNASYSTGGGQDAWIFLIHLTGLASFLGGVNFVVTMVKMRAPGMTWGRLPLFCWGLLIYAFLVILAMPEIAGTVTMLLTDRHFGTHWFKPDLGGSALLWQHLFWFFGHPEVYIMILPAFGMVSEIIPVFARKPVFGYKAMAASIAVIAFLAALVWAHHMFATPTPIAVLAFFMLTSFLIAVPTGIKIFNWVATLWSGTIVFRTALLFAVAFVAIFTIGGISGVFLAIFPVDWQLTDTYFVVAHIHYVLMGGSMFAVFAAIYYWFPKMTGRMMSESLGKWSFWLSFIGFNTTFLVQHVLGLEGMPRRIYTYRTGFGWEIYNQISTVGSFILAVGIGLIFINVLWSLKKGRRAGPDPWQANTLEWFTTSPPPQHNFDEIPVVRSVEPLRDLREEISLGAQTAPGQPVGERERERVEV